MVYATVLEAVDESHGGSSPLLGTILEACYELVENFNS
jgi:hypothetical protein